MAFRMLSWLPELLGLERGRGRIGVDIGAGAVKLAHWSGGGGAPLDYAIRALPGGAVVNRNVRDVDAVGAAIREAAESLGMVGKDAVAAVPTSAVLQRRLEVDTDLPDAELEAQILLEAERLAPWPLAEARMDFRRLGQTANGAGQALLTLCRREQVEMRAQALARGGLRAAAVDVEHHGLERALGLFERDAAGEESSVSAAEKARGASALNISPRTQRGGPVAVAEITPAAICLQVLAAGASLHCEERPFNGGETLRQGPEAYAEAVIRQLAHALQAFRASARPAPAGRIAQLWLWGDGAVGRNLAEQAGQLLALPVALAGLFPAEAKERNANEAPAQLLAAGLAIAGDVHGRRPANG